MELNDLLQKKNIDPKHVMVLRHRPTEPSLRKVFRWLALEKPDVYNVYQQSHGPIVEKAMTRAKYVASFIGHKPGNALFVGLYTVGGSRLLTIDEYRSVPGHIELKTFGMKDGVEGRTSVLFFDLALTEHYAGWKGKLIVDWPGLERSWWRWAERNTISVSAILEDSALDDAMPEWDSISLSWDDLRVLPARWKSALAQWRGIYYIFDGSDGKSYVGSAYGSENLFRRWQNYSATGHGGNSLLRKRDPRHFTFTILQRVSPDMDPDAVIQLESSWKNRLHTRAPQGLNDN
jgi:hypothetical protein